ncbi:rhodanese-like domain-containing protein [Pseudovibrio japonicus]|uniref:Rhodanese-like domain-containing protein n=1 Tax=Pseudovibrio japonicus TaxID=366534 RepID=A0ABQ3EQX0_9HYPH|nr:rhodanese-like domain-containing protein [Pseudovibrio japonicus]GHB46212.1 rhodanese-like domain-containing protein [Pseudovibrio japonicus]
MSSRALEYSAADPTFALAHFGAKIQVETDCTDVQADLVDGTAGFVLLDVRGPNAFARGHVDGAISFPYRNMTEESLAKWPMDTVFVVYCAGPHCNAADKAAYRLSQLGRPVKLMLGGVTGWIDEGFELASLQNAEAVA